MLVTCPASGEMRHYEVVDICIKCIPQRQGPLITICRPELVAQGQPHTFQFKIRSMSTLNFHPYIIWWVEIKAANYNWPMTTYAPPRVPFWSIELWSINYIHWLQILIVCQQRSTECVQIHSKLSRPFNIILINNLPVVIFGWSTME